MRALPKLTIFLFFYMLSTLILAQQSDVELLKTQKEKENTCEKHDHNSPSLFAKVMKAPFTGALFFYQKLISPVLGANCGYSTSCSRFSSKAIKKKGVIPGVLLTADRLTRCNHQAVDAIHYELKDAQGKVKDEKFYLE